VHLNQLRRYWIRTSNPLGKPGCGEKIMQGFLRKSAQSAGEDFFNPADIADHRRKIYSGISAQIRADLREKRVFQGKSAPICRRVFII
jgi:hypothetical protein